MIHSWEIIATNITEARKELQRLEEKIAGATPFDEVEFQIAMEHAYHHLNFAWNIRHQPTERYANLAKDDFEKWGRFPDDLQF